MSGYRTTCPGPGRERVEAASRRAFAVGASYTRVESILRAGLDAVPLPVDGYRIATICPHAGKRRTRRTMLHELTIEKLRATRLDVIATACAKQSARPDTTREVVTRVVVCNADPFRMIELVDRKHWPLSFVSRVDGYRRDGTSMKVNLCLRGLPKFTCLPEDRGQFGPTIHLLPDEKDVMRVTRAGFADMRAGRLSQFPAIEWYIHTTVDPSLRDANGRHNSALFVQWVPYEIAGSSWDAERDGYVKHLLSICDRFAPGTSDLVEDTFALAPPDIERHFGITRGHIHHVDNAFGFADRLPYATPIDGLYSCSAGCHPAGSVIGSAGHNAAQRVLRDLQA
jgi:phytoene dehydrogenase-like protein